MSTSTKIEWTNQTDNIIVAEQGGWWCRKISPGCKNCYAAKLNQSSYFHGNKLQYSGKAPKLKLRTDIIDGWKAQTKPRRHFVASMTDVFGDWVPEEWAHQFLTGMANAPRQTFQVLTKRPEVMGRYVASWLKLYGYTTVPANIWLGTSVENQECADERIPHLLRIPAAVRFLSCEPLLGPVDVSPWLVRDPGCDNPDPAILEFNACIHWVIAGGESGPGARPMHPDWAAGLRDQCKAAGVPFFFKQWGEWKPICEGRDWTEQYYKPNRIAKGYEDQAILNELYGRRCTIPHEVIHRDGSTHGILEPMAFIEGAMTIFKVGKKAAGRELEGVQYSEFPTAKEVA